MRLPDGIFFECFYSYQRSSKEVAANTITHWIATALLMRKTKPGGSLHDKNHLSYPLYSLAVIT